MPLCPYLPRREWPGCCVRVWQGARRDGDPGPRNSSRIVRICLQGVRDRGRRSSAALHFSADERSKQLIAHVLLPLALRDAAGEVEVEEIDHRSPTLGVSEIAVVGHG